MIRVDLRSDTVTKPTPEMRRAMYEAELGDDVYGEDPEVNLLQEKAATLLGKEAALLVASGTQGNLVSILVHTQRGEEIIVGDSSHIYNFEAMGSSVLGGIGMRSVPTEEDGMLDPHNIAAAVQPDDPHTCRSRLVCIENTHNLKSGRPLSSEAVATMTETARSHGLKVHVDGARLFNASVALGESPAQLVAHTDSTTFCLSKGLACPVGSVIVGDKDFIEEAHRWRKVLGTGMRQAGVIAAAGIVALDTMIDRLEEDHRNARRLAEALSEVQGLSIDPKAVETNILFLDVESDAGELLTERLHNEGVLVNGAKDKLRMVTHYGIDEEDADFAAEAIRRAAADVFERRIN